MDLVASHSVTALLLFRNQRAQALFSGYGGVRSARMVEGDSLLDWNAPTQCLSSFLIARAANVAARSSSVGVLLEAPGEGLSNRAETSQPVFQFE